MLESSNAQGIMDSIPQMLAPPVKLNLLIVDTDTAVRSACAEIGEAIGMAVESTGEFKHARELLRSKLADVLLVNLPAEKSAGHKLIAETHLLHPQMSVIAMTSSSSVNAAVEAMRCGASDYLTKPFDVEQLTEVLDRAMAGLTTDLEARRIREQLRLSKGLGAMIGRSTEMEKLYRILSKVAQTTHPVLILGESGTGKELVARTIHAYGPNADRPFLPVDCGAIASSLIESELFGHTKGAFTGADRSKDGLLVCAERGTAFLDEIGELSMDVQAKLLRALQEREVRPVGSTHSIPIRARIIAATNRDLAAMVERGAFRKDLYYRLNVVNLKLPPLRGRKEDIPLLVAHFLDRISKGKPIPFRLHDSALQVMMHYEWPGNIRELENAIESASALGSGPLIELGDMPTQLQREGLATGLPKSDQPPAGEEPGTEIIPLAVQERAAIQKAIRVVNGDKLRAAKLLGIGKTTLYRKLKEYKIEDELRGE